MTHDAVAQTLARSDLFRGLEADRLDHLARECHVRRFAKGEQVFARGDPGGGMFLVASGSIALSVTSADGGEVTLAVLSPPQTFGELAVIDDGLRVATTTARQASAVVVLPKAQVLRLLSEASTVSSAMFGALAALIRQLYDHAADLVLMDLRSRVSKVLLGLASRAAGGPVRPAGAVSVDLRLNRSELARLVGGSRQHVNWILAQLTSGDAIDRVGSRIVAVRPDRLGSGL